jgi:hypothetical protein
VVISAILAAAGTLAVLAAVVFERLMHRHRRPGVTYWQATLRRDGGWRRGDLFDDAGLTHQRRASLCGITGAGLWLLALASWVLSRVLSPT